MIRNSARIIPAAKAVAAAVSCCAATISIGVAAESRYTSIAEQNCRKFDVTRIGDEEFAASRVCPGRGGHKVFISEYDLREALTVGKTIRQAGNEPAARDHYRAFNHYEVRIEWRSGKDGRPYSLIVGWSYANNENLETKGRSTSERLLIVMRLPPGPVRKVAYIDRDANSNALELAQSTADTVARDFKCGIDKVQIVGKRGRAVRSLSPRPGALDKQSPPE